VTGKKKSKQGETRRGKGETTGGTTKGPGHQWIVLRKYKGKFQGDRNAREQTRRKGGAQFETGD